MVAFVCGEHCQVVFLVRIHARIHAVEGSAIAIADGKNGGDMNHSLCRCSRLRRRLAMSPCVKELGGFEDRIAIAWRVSSFDVKGLG